MTESKSTIIYQGFGYEAVICGFKTAKGPFLVVSRDGKGKYVCGEEATEWAKHIQTAIDSKESAALCRAIYRS